MSCALPDGWLDADSATADLIISRLARFGSRNESNFFAAVGFQGPRLPWVFPYNSSVGYPPASEFNTTHFPTADGLNRYEFFRPTEVNLYSDIQNVTHDNPMIHSKQQQVVRAYLSTISHVDTQIGRVLQAVRSLGQWNNTVICVTADHGQSLGESNLWSMMGLLDQSTQVPLLIHHPGVIRSEHVYSTPVELIDLYPTLAALAGLPTPPKDWHLPGKDLSHTVRKVSTSLSDFESHELDDVVGVGRALSQITRCYNCTAAYDSPHTIMECKWDAVADMEYLVPCCMTNKSKYDLMGVSVRTSKFRYTQYCEWDGMELQVNFSHCVATELFDHRNTSSLLFDPESETKNVAGDMMFVQEEKLLREILINAFSSDRSHELLVK